MNIFATRIYEILQHTKFIVQLLIIQSNFVLHKNNQCDVLKLSTQQLFHINE